MSDLLQPGQVFAGRYRIERFLAQGGFGAVYVAEQIETELRVAVKVLWPHVLQSETAVAKFKLEARIAGRVGSEHIVQVLDAGFDEPTGMPFLVMELLDGQELEDFVLKNGPLSAERAVRYLSQVASALDKAHGYRNREGELEPIVHRDLKPENLFLCRREHGDPMVKVLDFGIAKVLSQSTQVSQEIKGTPLYMAYEQASGTPVSPQTDVWALGLIAFFLLTGRSYWKSGNSGESTLVQLFSEVLSLPIDPPSVRVLEMSAPVALPAGFDAWFSRCVNREPSARFASAGECVRELGLVLGQAAPSAAHTSFARQAFNATNFASPEMLSQDTLDTQPSAVAPSGPGSTTGALSLGAGAVTAARARRSIVPFAIAAVCLLGAVVALAAFLTSAGQGEAATSATSAIVTSVAVEPTGSVVPAETAATEPAVAPATASAPEGVPNITAATGASAELPVPSEPAAEPAKSPPVKRAVAPATEKPVRDVHGPVSKPSPEKKQNPKGTERLYDDR
jgi:serine/threonine-protein kinase